MQILFLRKWIFLTFILNIMAIKILAVAEKPLVIVVPSYNNSKWVKQNLEAIYNQSYDNYLVIYINDCSSDDTLKKVKALVTLHEQWYRTIVVDNHSRYGAMENLYNAIVSCDDQVIIITIDGDDWLANDHILSFINKVYSGQNIWLTYGQYRESNGGGIGFNRAFSKIQISRSLYRNTDFPVSHLRTFYAGLFKRIKPADLKGSDGKFYSMTWDKAMMAPMLEMAGHHHKFIADVLYIYNTDNPISDHRIDAKLQNALCKEILAKPKYLPLINIKFATAEPLGVHSCCSLQALQRNFGTNCDIFYCQDHV